MTNFAGAVPGPDGQPLDQIRITGVSGRGRHGVLASERVTGQEFRADIVLHLDARRAAEGDDLRATVSYADVAQEAHDILVGEPVDLIETLAERIAAAVLGHEPVQAVDVTVHKPQAPIPVSFTDVEVSIRRDRVATPPAVAVASSAGAVSDEDQGTDGVAEPDAGSAADGRSEAGDRRSEPTATGALAMSAVDPLTAPIGDVQTDETPVAEPAAPSEPAEFAGTEAPVSTGDLVVPPIVPAEPTRETGNFEAQSGEPEQAVPDQAEHAEQDRGAGSMADALADLMTLPAEPVENHAQASEPGMLDGASPADRGAPAFEPRSDAPVRPDDEDSVATHRPAYDFAAQESAAGTGPPEAETHPHDAAGQDTTAQLPDSGAWGAEQQAEPYEPESYQPEAYPSEPYQPEPFQLGQDASARYEPELYQPEMFQPEVRQPEAHQPEAAQPDLQQQFSAEPQRQPVFAEQQAPAPGTGEGSGSGDRLDEVPAEPVEVVLALGANLGDPQATLRAAVVDLDRISGLQITDVSPLARTAAVGGPEQPDYLNAVVVARTNLAPRGLLHACQAIEYAHGRTREEHWGPRSLDIDIITYGPLTAAAEDLEVPHPRAHERAFVLEPWSQLKPDAVLPGLGGGPVAQLAATAEDRQGIRWLALDWLTESNSGADPTGDVEPQPTASHRPYDPPVQPEAPPAAPQQPQPAPPVREQHVSEQPFHPDRARDQVVQGVPGQQPGQPGPGYPYQQQTQVQDPFQPQGMFQPPQNGAPPQGFGADSMRQPQQRSGSVPPPEEALVPAPQTPPATPQLPISAPPVPPAVRETARHEIAAEQSAAEQVHPVFAPVRPQPGDAPFAPVRPTPGDQQRAQPSDDRPAWAPVRTDEHGQRG